MPSVRAWKPPSQTLFKILAKRQHQAKSSIRHRTCLLSLFENYTCHFLISQGSVISHDSSMIIPRISRLHLTTVGYLGSPFPCLGQLCAILSALWFALLSLQKTFLWEDRATKGLRGSTQLWSLNIPTQLPEDCPSQPCPTQPFLQGGYLWDWWPLYFYVRTVEEVRDQGLCLYQPRTTFRHIQGHLP